MSPFMRRVALGFLFVIVAMFGLSSIASADPSVTVEPVTASSPDYGQITFTDGSNPATVAYGPAGDSLTNSVTLVPNQVITVSLDDVDTIYWQATSSYGTSTVHAQDTDDWTGFIVFLAFFWGVVLLFLLLFIVID